MPEFPEIFTLTQQLKQRLAGKAIADIEVLQPKCLNLPAADFRSALQGAQIRDATQHGKWIQIETSAGWLLLNLGMGGEVLILTSQTLPEKRRLVFQFTDGACLSVNFWWFGYAHYVAPGALERHEMTAKLGPNALDLDAQALGEKLKDQRGRIKAFLLDQSRIAGIGNAYVHDILFLARLHPLRKIDTLTEDEVEALAQAIHGGLQPSIDKGGAFYEMDTYGKKGGFTMEDILVGYKEGQLCPECATPIEKIKTGSTSSFICPHCQSL